MKNIQLIQGDCLIEMKNIPDKSIDMILCDLPYGTTWAKWDSIINFNSLWAEYNRICRGCIVLFSTQPFTTKLINSNIQNYKYTWYWIKNIKGNYLNAKRQPLRQLEEINIFNNHIYHPQGIKPCNKISARGSSSKITMQNYSNKWIQKNEKYPSNILYYPLDTEKLHPTQKPVALLDYLIKTYTNENELVLDNCMGSGSTGIACINTNRRFIGIEKDDKYFDIAVNRIDKHIKENNLGNIELSINK